MELLSFKVFQEISKMTKLKHNLGQKHISHLQSAKDLSNEVITLKEVSNWGWMNSLHRNCTSNQNNLLCSVPVRLLKEVWSLMSCFEVDPIGPSNIGVRISQLSNISFHVNNAYLSAVSSSFLIHYNQELWSHTLRGFLINLFSTTWGFGKK